MTVALPKSGNPPASHADEATTAFERERPRLRRLAYRMLGSTAEADDVVQDAWLRWRGVAHAEVRSAAALLTRIVARLCLDVRKSARARRETYVGVWLPEPLPDTEPSDPDDMTLPLMLALERLSPQERAAFLLHDVFGEPMAQVAVTLSKTPEAVRQLAVRARRRLRDEDRRFLVARDEGERLADAFYSASKSGDVAVLSRLLAEEAVLRADGGGRARAFPNPIVGRSRLLRMFQGLHRKDDRAGDPPLMKIWIDGLPGYVSRERGGVLQTTALKVRGGRIEAIYVTRNPEKLRGVDHLLRAAAQAVAAP